MSGLHLHGPVPMDSPAYVERQFEGKVLRQVLAGRWVLLLGPRQHGKTTGLLRIKAALDGAGILCARVDLQGMPPHGSYEHMLGWFAKQVGRGLGRQEFRDVRGDDSGQLQAWLERAVEPGRVPVVVMVDEASAIRDPQWLNAFYGQIRSIATERASAGEEELAKRITFVFSGTFRPESLVDQRNSPFNVCEPVETDDLSADDAAALWMRVTGQSGNPLVSAAYSLVGGQPYLLQRLFQAITEADPQDQERALRSAAEALQSGADGHMQGLFGAVLGEPKLMDLVAAMVRDGGVPNEPADPDYRYLQVIGLARRDATRLVFKNRAYAEFALSSPQLVGSMSTRPLHAGPLIMPAEGADAPMAFMQDARLREIATAAYRGAVTAYNAGIYRLALAGFGSALEALLLEWLLSLTPSDLASKLQAALNAGTRLDRFEDPANPTSWRLVTLVKVARAGPASIATTEPPDLLREWRNLIHPGKALAHYLCEQDLEPEARGASAHLSAFIRDVRTVHP